MVAVQTTTHLRQLQDYLPKEVLTAHTDYVWDNWKMLSMTTKQMIRENGET